MTAPLPEYDDTAHCRKPGTDPEAFFPPPGGHGEALTRAKAICAGCPWLDPCLAYALTHAVTGVWGKTGTRERQEIRRQLGITAVSVRFPTVPDSSHGTPAGERAHFRRGETLCDVCAAELRHRRAVKKAAS